MTWKDFARDYLSFSRRERIAGLVISLLIILVIFAPAFFSDRNSSVNPSNADTAWVNAVKKLEIKDAEDKKETRFSDQPDDNNNTYHYDRSAGSSSTSATLFYFDPNTLDKAGWEKLGVKGKTIHTIQNYLSKGGHFYNPGDLKKIYGLHPDDYSRLEPYIKIKDGAINDKPVEFAKKETEPKRFSYNSIDINTADTTAFISLPGIGGKLAARIVNFRDKLGGFYSINQVGETYGLPDSTFQKIKQYMKLENTSIKKININTATVDELKAHPYIRYSIANPIVAYRNEHGLFSKVEDIKKVMAVTDEIYNKIAPYLTL
ncbi:MAG TPA: helix-hairpin-helix domain-containing protein [Chitinophagaceae bacterium]|nr:helix-hairpin-helix domain-containing protein [Chitinophagaceae bacterium]